MNIDKAKAEQCRIAATIYEEGCDWEFTMKGSDSWKPPMENADPMCVYASGYDIRIKPQPDPYAEPKRWFKEDGKIDVLQTDGAWYDGVQSVSWSAPATSYRRHDPLRAVKEHFEKGGKVEWKGTLGVWSQPEEPSFHPELEWRIAPEPVMVPLEVGDVPIGSAIRHIHQPLPVHSIATIDAEGIAVNYRNCHPSFYRWEHLKQHFEILRPGSSTWEPCHKPSVN